ncbi:MAG TPA: DUF2085 domain-containing protein [Anaerolineae bacterium]|nr:DUF2085 domain-containing protein [Anaerolineae bacterium]HQK14679.1 DUF2085 domain-containing protein [Anaerolineae bacterium]
MSEPEDTDNHAPSTEAILNEAQRRIQERMQQEIPPGQRTLVEKLNRFVFWLARHWLALFNTLTALFLGGAILAPVFFKIGMPTLANMLYAAYRPLCHQYPFRSWFLFGPQLAYPLTTPISVIEMNALRLFTGDAATGYKVALCQRDVAIYGCLLLGGLAYAGLRRKQEIPPWPMWRYFIFGIMPMMLDGGIQWLSYVAWVLFPGLIPVPFETTPLMRTLTGALFGLGLVATAYPYLNEYFEDVYHTLERKLNTTNSPLEATL